MLVAVPLAVALWGASLFKPGKYASPVSVRYMRITFMTHFVMNIELLCICTLLEYYILFYFMLHFMMNELNILFGREMLKIRLVYIPSCFFVFIIILN